MADHEHAYLICENKSLVEGVPKEQYDSEMADTLKLENKGTAGGVAPLGPDGKVPDDFLSVIKDVQKADGTSVVSDKVAKLPEIPDVNDFIKQNEKGAANGVVPLTSAGVIDDSYYSIVSSQSTGTSGYIKFKKMAGSSYGIMIQWKASYSPSATTYNVNFSQTFAYKPVVRVSPHMNSSSNTGYKCFGYSVTTSGFTAYTGTSSDTVDWLAIGWWS